MIERLDALRAEGERALAQAGLPSDLEAARVRFLGRKSELTGILRGLKDLPPEERTQIGARANQTRARLESLLADAAPAIRAPRSTTVRTLAVLGAASMLSASARGMPRKL